MPTRRDPPNVHPLAPLTSAEIATARDILTTHRDLSNDARFIEITLNEPSKNTLGVSTTNNADIDRQATLVVRDIDERVSYEGIVSLDDESIMSWEPIAEGQPRLIAEEFVAVERVVKEDPAFREAVKRRGADPDLTIVSAWSAGYDFIPTDIDRSRRLAHGIAWANANENENASTAYNRPLSGIHAWVDLDDLTVIKIVDTGPKTNDILDTMQTTRYRAADRDLRADLKPYNVVQPEGPSWAVDGHTVEWQNWSFRVGFNHREGLVLYNIGYETDGDTRSIINRASWPEVVTPYTDPDPDHNWKAPFDAGEYGLGRLANSLTEGCDCLGYMHYWDAVLNNGNGEPLTIPNAICLHEEDYGLLWKHYDWRENDTEVRRNRRLVVSFIATIGNYDFGFYWYFYQDGSIEAQVRLTGCNATGLLPENTRETGYAETIGPNHKSMLHQHVFNCRLDFAIDGPENTVREVELTRVPYGPDGYDPTPHAEPSRRHLNPHGNAAYAQRTRLETETGRMTKPRAGRYWEIINENKTNDVTGEPVGYRLVEKAGTNTAFAALPGSANWKRAGFASNHFWVTPHDPDERYPAGDYPNQHPGESGLPAWINQERSIANEDLVVWYNLCQTHVCAPEDWPVLPMKMMSFNLEPVHFFEENPATDVPPEHDLKDIDKWSTENHEDLID